MNPTIQATLAIVLAMAIGVALGGAIVVLLFRLASRNLHDNPSLPCPLCKRIEPHTGWWPGPPA